MKEEVIVRKMEWEDISGVLEIENKSFAIPWTKNAFENELKKNQWARYYVGILENKVVAYGGMWLVVDEGHITNIAVHPDYRGKKIGKEIVKTLIQEGLKMKIYRLTLEVRRSNEVAQNLYKSLGFIPCGIRPGYYHDNGEDAIIMWKDLV